MQKTTPSVPLNRGGIEDLPLLRTQIAVHQKSQEPSFWELVHSFVLVAYASLAASRTFLQRLQACLNFLLKLHLQIFKLQILFSFTNYNNFCL